MGRWESSGIAEKRGLSFVSLFLTEVKGRLFLYRIFEGSMRGEKRMQKDKFRIDSKGVPATLYI